MLPGMEMMGCWDLAVPGEVMRHVVQVESSFNPYAIGVVGGRLVRQPRTLAEALATVRMLEEKGYNFSVGLAQVNRYNLTKYGLSSYERAFQTCPNLQAGSRILAECHQRAGGDWGKAFSCYYSGNFVTGFRHGYVRKVMTSMGTDADAGVRAIALADASPGTPGAPRRPSRVETSGGSLLARRTRSETPAAAPTAAPATSASFAMPASAQQAAPAGHPDVAAMQAPVPAEASAPAPVKVRLVGAPPVSAPALPPAPIAGPAAATPSSAPGSAVPDPIASKEGSRDEAFVF